jgi:hypothetical protein
MDRFPADPTKGFHVLPLYYLHSNSKLTNLTQKKIHRPPQGQ